jgi:hypothetical protein
MTGDLTPGYPCPTISGFPRDPAVLKVPTLPNRLFLPFLKVPTLPNRLFLPFLKVLTLPNRPFSPFLKVLT